MKQTATRWLAVAAFAAALNAGSSWAMGPHHGFDHDDGRMLAYLADELDLSAAQESEIRALHEAVSKQSADDRQMLSELRERMHAQLDDFDAGEAQRIAERIGEITTRLVYTTTSTRAAVRALLTAEQRAHLDELMEQSEGRRRGWKEKRKFLHGDD